MAKGIAMKKLIGGALAALALTLAPVAHADDTQGFLDDLTAAGFPVMLSGTARAISGGYLICQELRGGMSVEQVAGQANLMERPYADQYISASQHRLCPDTLH